MSMRNRRDIQDDEGVLSTGGERSTAERMSWKE